MIRISNLSPTIRVWKVEEVGDYSILLYSTQAPPKNSQYHCLLPNATNDFIAKHGKHDYSEFVDKFSVKVKDTIYTPETLILYFEDKVPYWAEVGMEVLF